jgi:RsiW-degrading membrane proteinase PrsW (M82 family)
MNQVFDFKRWILLVGKHWSENQKKYLLSLAAIVALLVIWYSFVLLVERHNPYPEEMQVATYYIGMAIAGCLFGSLFFSEAASGPKAMHFLSVPASALEKLLVGLLFGVVLFFICYTSIFYLVDFIMVKIANGLKIKNEPGDNVSLMHVINVFTRPQGTGNEFPNVYFYFLVIYINLQSAFILGSLKEE